jgi:hypothetical protein
MPDLPVWNLPAADFLGGGHVFGKKHGKFINYLLELTKFLLQFLEDVL